MLTTTDPSRTATARPSAYHDAYDPAVFARLRAREFQRLDAARATYLDYTGAALATDSQMRSHLALLRGSVLGNPHSDSPASRASTDWIARARERVLRFFDADPAEYEVIFTANASAACKLVGESWGFGPEAPLILSTDNHNSVNGIREHARSAGAPVACVPLDDELRLSADECVRALASVRGRGLVALPAQSNFSGVRHPLDLVDVAVRAGHDVLLDAAAFVPTSALSLRDVPAHFVALSFYKMFGYPTGIGALIARSEALARLQRPGFAGGTVNWVSVEHGLHSLRAGAEGFEDGTPDFQAMPAVVTGLDFLTGIGMRAITRHVSVLTELLLGELLELRHPSGAPLVWLHGPPNMHARGGTIAINVLESDGRVIPFGRVESRAREDGISVRGGCFCNPGASERAFGFPAVESARCLAESVARGYGPEELARCMGIRTVGAIRISLGVPTTEADVRRAVECIRSCAFAPDRPRR